MAYLLLIGGIVLLLLSGDWLVKGAVDLALRLKIDMLVVGMTVVSFATSAPELLVSLDAAINGFTDISFGNVIGSNIANLALILGLTALVFPMKVSVQTYRIDFWIMLLVTVFLFLFIFWDERLNFWESGVLVLLLVIYNFFQIWASRRSRTRIVDEDPELEHPQPKKNMYWMIGYLLAGIIGLRYGATFLIDGAVQLAESWGVSERVIGISVVSVGTSLPELAASMIASLKGEQELSLGNLIGSNIFNVLAVLGITGLFVELPVKNPEILTFDIPYFIGVSLLLYPFMRYIRKGTIDRWQGLVMFLVYVAYLYLVF
jgi:cation:H+ antiporter